MSTTENNITLTYRCRDIGYGVESGVVDGHFTGERDVWGKLTFKATDGRTLYLFEDEISAVDAAEVL